MSSLNLGCGNQIKRGAVNHNLIKHRTEVDIVWDLNNLPWPWKDKSFSLIFASSVFEHLQIDLVQCLDQCWRILTPGGRLLVKVPHWRHDNAYADPTHRWRYSLRSFDVFNPETKLGKQIGFYTKRKWRFLKGPKLNDHRSSVLITLAVRKGIQAVPNEPPRGKAEARAARAAAIAKAGK